MSFHLLDGVDQRIRIGRRMTDDERIEPLHREILDRIRLACGIRRGLHDDLGAGYSFSTIFATRSA